MGVELYCGINETKWNRHPVAPGPLACVAPVYGASIETKRENCVIIPPDTLVLSDSGAFSDGPGQRLGFAAALDRQLAHAHKYGYHVSHLASYDLLIDEVWTDGNRYKRRWSEADAEAAVAETVAAAEYLARHRNGTGLVLSAQGVTAHQYLQCSRRIASLVSPGDWFGFGGWCIIGKMPAVMMPTFRETIWLVVPYLAGAGVEHIHIWGVIYGPALGELLWLCNEFGLELSTDSAGPSRRPALGVWGYQGWSDRNYKRAPVETRGLDRARHVQATREWLANLEATAFYREPPRPANEPSQLYLF